MPKAAREPSIRPLFLMSLPRTGSTLVQRVLAAHPGVATASEPWLLLPLLYARREDGIRAEYCHMVAANAIVDFAEAREGGTAAFDQRLREFVQGVYQDASSNGAVYFLDKTPHYHFVAEELFALFPDARFLFLWRNPLAVLASLLTTFRLNRFEPYIFRTEFTRGQVALTEAYVAHPERSHAVRFEDLVGPEAERHWRDAFAYLELDWEPSVLESFADVELQGRFGDPTGVKAYRSLSSEPLDKWRASFRGPVRQQWTRRLVDQLAPSLAVMGYDRATLLEELEAAGSASAPAVARDTVTLAGSAAERFVRRSAVRLPDIPRPLGPSYGAGEPLSRRLLHLARSLTQ